MMQRLGNWIVGHPMMAGVGLLLMTALAVSGITRLEFDDGLRSAFASDHPDHTHYELNRLRFTQSDIDIAVLFRSDRLVESEVLEAVRGFALDASFASQVVNTHSIFALRTSPDREGRTEPIIPPDLDDAEALAEAMDRVRQSPLGGDRLLSEDRTLTLVLVSLDPVDDSLEAARETLGELEALAREASDRAGSAAALDVSITGLAPIRQIVVDGMVADTVMLNGIGITIGVLICLIVLRNPLLAILTFLPPAFALTWVLGMMGLTGLPINTVTNAVPVLILVLSFADSLHLTFDVRRERGANGDMPSAVAKAFAVIGPACALTSFTTSIAFSALLISESALIRSLGWVGVFGTLVSTSAVLWAHPVIFRTALALGFVDRSLRKWDPAPVAVLRARGLYEFGLRHYRLVTLGTIGALALAVLAYSTVKPVYSLLENVDDTDPVMVALEALDAELAPTGTIDIPLTRPADAPEGDALWPGALDEVSTVHAAVEKTFPGSPVISLDSIADYVGSGDGGRTSGRVSSLLDEMSDIQRARFISADNDAVLIRLYVRDEGARAMRALLVPLRSALADAAEDAGIDPARLGPPTGLLAMSAEATGRMIRHLNVSFVFAVAASGLFIALWFRNWRFGLVALVPNILPIAFVGAFLALTGWGMQFSSAIALTIAFGIAVDDTVHLLNRLKHNAPADSPFDSAAIRQSYSEIAPVLIVTTAVLSFGLLSTQTSAIPTIAYFGMLVATVLCLALFAVLGVLPAWLAAFSRLFGRRPAASAS